MQEIKVVLFDLGNTLVYFDGNWNKVLDEAILRMAQHLSITFSDTISTEVFYDQYKAALMQYYVERDIDEIEKTTSSILSGVLKTEYQIVLTTRQLDNILKEFYSHTGSHWKLEEETLPMLKHLQDEGYKLGLISNAAHAPDVYTQLYTYDLTRFFQQILVSAQVGVRKPNALIFRKAIDFFKVTPSEMVMVGDTLSADIIGSRKAGMKNIWVARWASRPSNHYQDDAIIPDRKITCLSEIPDIVKNWDKK